MKILLTGASGMVGRNILNNAESQKHEWLSPSSATLDLLDYRAVENYMDKHAPDFVIHAAGKVGGIQANIRDPVSFLIDNLDMGRNVLMAASSTGVRRLINFGSTCMYPKDHDGALLESDVLGGPLEPTNEGYAIAKIAVARLAEYLSRENANLQYKTIIPCNLYGLYDKFDPRWSHMIPSVIYKLHQAKIENIKSVEIWGNGEARREFLFASDLADAVFAGIERVDNMPSLMNIGLGHDYTVNEYYEIAAKVIGYTGGFHHDISKPTGMQRKLSSTRKATEWGWQPSHTLEQGLEKTYQYYINTLGK
jgi:GDP-L-fucose synthase